MVPATGDTPNVNSPAEPATVVKHEPPAVGHAWTVAPPTGTPWKRTVPESGARTVVEALTLLMSEDVASCTCPATGVPTPEICRSTSLPAPIEPPGTIVAVWPLTCTLAAVKWLAPEETLLSANA